MSKTGCFEMVGVLSELRYELNKISDGYQHMELEMMCFLVEMLQTETCFFLKRLTCGATVDEKDKQMAPFGTCS